MEAMMATLVVSGTGGEMRDWVRVWKQWNGWLGFNGKKRIEFSFGPWANESKGLGRLNEKNEMGLLIALVKRVCPRALSSPSSSSSSSPVPPPPPPLASVIVPIAAANALPLPRSLRNQWLGFRNPSISGFCEVRLFARWIRFGFRNRWISVLVMFYTVFSMMSGLTSATVFAVIGKNASIAFEDIATNFAPPVNPSGKNIGCLRQHKTAKLKERIGWVKFDCVPPTRFKQLPPV
ncbi:hypothetical protein Droror1_Dr00004244 [Drosera rotundifolia]